MSSVAVIVICRNEEKHIRRCLDSLLANDYDRRLMTILVVDGMSTDGTRQIVAEYSQKHGFVRLVDNPRKVIPAALNAGIRVAGEIGAQVLLRADAHAVYAPNYISASVRGLEQYGADNIGGIRETYPGNTPWEQAVAVVWCHPFAAANAVFRTALGANRPRPVDTVWCGCFRMSVFDRIGVFNELMLRTEDREFNNRLLDAGGTILMDPSIRCTYFPRTAPGNYVRYALITGFWLYYARRFTRTRLIFWRNLVPLAFVLWHLAAILVGVLLPPLLPFLLAPIAAYWGLNALISVQLAWTHRNAALFPCLFVLFPLTHYPYGLGNLYGWLRAAVEGKYAPRGDPAPSPIGARTP